MRERSIHKMAELGRNHWFYLLLPFWVIAALGFRATHPWAQQPAWGEAVTLFDWCLFVPSLYVLCYRTMPRRALMLRTLALACSGIWVAGKILPDTAETVLSHLGWLRGAGIAVLVLFEGLALVAMLRVLFGTAPDAAELEQQGIPPIIARMMLAEARFWRWVWSRLRGR